MPDGIDFSVSGQGKNQARRATIIWGGTYWEMDDGKSEKRDQSQPVISRRDFVEIGLKGAIVASSAGLIGGCQGQQLPLRDEKGRLPFQSKQKSYIDAYQHDACLVCGACLEGCVFKRLDEEDAIRGIKRCVMGKMWQIC